MKKPQTRSEYLRCSLLSLAVVGALVALTSILVRFWRDQEYARVDSTHPLILLLIGLTIGCFFAAIFYLYYSKGKANRQPAISESQTIDVN